jgi:hypothetical protein
MLVKWIAFAHTLTHCHLISVFTRIDLHSTAFGHVSTSSGIRMQDFKNEQAILVCGLNTWKNYLFKQQLD